MKVTIGGQVYDESSLEVSTTAGYLDFEGRPTYTIPHYHGSTAGKNIEVEYDFSQSQVFKKPIILMLIVLVFLVSTIFLKRFKLEAFAEKQE